MILQMNALDVRRMGQFITGDNDPAEIDINSLYFLLVLTNQHLNFLEKLQEIVGFIIFN